MLAVKALLKYISGLAIVIALVFLPAGTFTFFNGWLFIGILFVPILALGIILLIKAPNLLEKRLNTKESNTSQKVIVALLAVMFIAGFVVAGLDHRFTLSHIPLWVVGIASVTLLASYALYAEVMRENAYLSRTVEVQKGQKVVDTGLYGIVRHPMYAATVCMFLSIPVVLGSWWALLCFLPYVVMIAFRIIDEEKVLENGLEGYVEYKNKVRYRLIPFVW